MTPAQLRARLTGPDPADAASVTPDSELPDGPGLAAAAVLVGIVTGPAPGVLLTRRTDHLRHHSGQVSFPGGRIDPGDASPEAAALREAKEEVGLEPDHTEVLGRLRDYVTVSAYRVTPVVALVQPGFVARPSAHEVAAVFQLPLTVLLDPAAPQRRDAEFRGRMRSFWVWPHSEHYIWGATASMLVHLARRLRGEV